MKYTQEQEEKVISCIAACGSLLNRKLDADELKLWMRKLAQNNIPLQRIQAACDKFTSDPGRDFMPSFPKFLAGCTGQLDARKKAIEVWEGIVDHLEHKGAGHPMDMDEPTASAVRAIGGWSHVGGMSYKDLDYARNLFLEAYRGKAETIRDYLPEIDEEDGPRKMIGGGS